jgi:hypothetical protein
VDREAETKYYLADSSENKPYRTQMETVDIQKDSNRTTTKLKNSAEIKTKQAISQVITENKRTRNTIRVRRNYDKIK